MVKPGNTKSRSKKSSLPPGSQVYIGEQRVGQVKISLIDYDEGHFQEREIKNVKDCFPFKETATVTWINVDGLHPEVVKEVGEHYGLHPLVQEDILNTDQRAKLEEFDDYLYLVFRKLHVVNGSDRIGSEQLSLIIGANFILSFQESPGDVFDIIRERLRTSSGKIRKLGPDHLAYSLIDASVDNYFAILEEVGERIGVVEETITSRPNQRTSHVLHHLRRELVFLRRAVWPLRDVVATMVRSESKLVRQATRVYLRDVYDHTVQVLETIETFRDLLAGALDVYLSAMSNRLNEVIKVLTLITTIFIPLSFVASIYGMNFKHMPELEQPWGYPAVLVSMVVMGLGMVFYFKKRKWL